MSKLTVSEDKFIQKSLHLQAQSSSFWIENKAESECYLAKTNAWKFPEQVKNNFEKIHKTTFLTLKLIKKQISPLPKRFCIEFIFDFWVPRLAPSDFIKKASPFF